MFVTAVIVGRPVEALYRTFLGCPRPSAGRKEAMRERVHADDGVRLVRPRIKRLSPAMQHEATVLLAGLLLAAARRDGASVCDGALGGVCPGAFGDATCSAGSPERPYGSKGSGR